jgi:hypothetical protein
MTTSKPYMTTSKPYMTTSKPYMTTSKPYSKHEACLQTQGLYRLESGWTGCAFDLNCII